MTKVDVRPSALAGTWYSGQAEVLEKEVDSYLRHAARYELDGEVVGLLVPHAGHRYSGPVAGSAFQAVKGNHYDTVVVVSPYHALQNHPILTTRHDAYQTPLGGIPVDRENLALLESKLTANLGQTLHQLRRDNEHSVEIELPFLQRALAGDFALLPLMLTAQDPATALALGQSLAETLAGQNALLVASTDLSHFYPEETANRLDKTMLEAIETFDPGNVIGVQSCGTGQACGYLAVLAVMEAANGLGAQKVQIIDYATSGKTSGDYSRVVGYGAGVFVK